MIRKYSQIVLSRQRSHSDQVALVPLCLQYLSLWFRSLLQLGLPYRVQCTHTPRRYDVFSVTFRFQNNMLKSDLNIIIHCGLHIQRDIINVCCRRLIVNIRLSTMVKIWYRHMIIILHMRRGTKREYNNILLRFYDVMWLIILFRYSFDGILFSYFLIYRWYRYCFRFPID